MDDQLRELVALGKEHFQRGDYSLAAGQLEQVVARGAAFAMAVLSLLLLGGAAAGWVLRRPSPLRAPPSSPPARSGER